MIRWITLGILAGISLLLYLLYFNNTTQLHTVEVELNSTQTQLELTRTELGSNNAKLADIETEMQSTKDQLQSTETKLGTTETELQSIKDELQSAETELANTLDSLDTIQAELDEKEIELTELQIDYDGLMAGHGYTIKDPTYGEMMRFLEDDDTDEAEYIKDEYECTGFATDLCNRAEEKGIRCAYVTIKFPGGRGHTIVAFDTIDKGLTYIEPQYDDLVEIEIGKSFYKCVVPKGSYTYEKPAYDDTIEEVLVAW